MANHSEELQALPDDNITLQMRLEDYENRAHCLKIRIGGLPETVVDLQATITALFQDLAPSIPLEYLEMDRVHRALAPQKSGGPS